MPDLPKSSQIPKPTRRRPTMLIWLTSLLLPGLLIGLVGIIALFMEARHHIFSIPIGRFLLKRNATQIPHGAVWQGILANRRSQVGIDSLNLNIPKESLPPALLTTDYTHEQRTNDFQILRAQPRLVHLKIDQITGKQLNDIAQSLHIYRRGQALLEHAKLPAATFYLQARIQAQVALESDGLFSLIHHHLQAQNAAEAWSFIDIPDTEKTFWRSFLKQVITADPADTTRISESPTVAAACRDLLSTWQDSLHQVEITRLQSAWTKGIASELRILHHVDLFTGYAVIDTEFPVRFQISTDQASAILGPVPQAPHD